MTKLTHTKAQRELWAAAVTTPVDMDYMKSTGYKFMIKELEEEGLDAYDYVVSAVFTSH